MKVIVNLLGAGDQRGQALAKVTPLDNGQVEARLAAGGQVFVAIGDSIPEVRDNLQDSLRLMEEQWR